jgi:hypothetical protein
MGNITQETGAAIRLRTTFTRDGLSSFEVVIIRLEAERVKFGKLTPQHEVYPTTSQWGTYGWSFGPGDREIVLGVAEAVRMSAVG